MKISRFYFLAFAIISLNVALMLYFLTASTGWGDDFAGYIMQARSIANGSTQNFLDSNRFTITQSSFVIGPIVYPWGYPVLLAPIFKLYGLSLMQYKLVGIFFYFIFLLVLFFGSIKMGLKKYSLILLLVFAINPFMVHYTNAILSDMPFLVFSTAAIFWMEAMVIRSRAIVNRYADDVVLGILIACAFLMRINGILLLCTLFLIQIVQLREKFVRQAYSWGDNLQAYFLGFVLASIPYIFFAVTVFLVNACFPSDDSAHVSVLKDVSLLTIASNFVYYLRIPTDFFGGSPWIYIVSLLIFIYGIYRSWRTQYCLWIYMGLTMVLYAVWPGRQGLRFLFPILPFYVMFLLIGAHHLYLLILKNSAVNGRLKANVFYGYLVILFGFSTFNGYVRLLEDRKNPDGPYSSASQAMFTYVRDQTPPESVIIFRNPRAMALLGDRRSVMINDEASIGIGDYLVLDVSKKGDASQLPLAWVSEPKSSGISLAYQNEQFFVYRLPSH